MYAVIRSGGKQYRVQPGDIFQIEKLEGDPGASVKFDQVLMCAKANGEDSEIWLGKPTLNGASVDAEIVGQGRGDKILIVKMKRRKQYRRTQGHRQYYTQVLVTGVSNGSGETQSLSAEEKKSKIAGFCSNLKPKGLAFSPKAPSQRTEVKAATPGASADQKTAAPAEKKATATKKAATATKTAAKKKAK